MSADESQCRIFFRFGQQPTEKKRKLASQMHPNMPNEKKERAEELVINRLPNRSRDDISVELCNHNFKIAFSN